MRGLQKSKRVSWPSDLNLCQVRLFLSDESPSQVGLSAQDHLQAKTSWLLQPTGMGFNDNLPPGFEGALPANLLQNNVSQIPLIKWLCPPRFVLDFTWQVVAGEESKDVEIQSQREMRVLEAIYPRPSAIPPNSSVLMGIEDSPYDDLNTPLIPITPIEDEDAVGDTSVDPVEQNTTPMSSQDTLLAHGMPSASQNLIDQDLLIKILSDPKLVERLITDHRATTNPHIIPKPRPPGIILSEPPLVQISRPEAGAPSLAAPPSGPFDTPPYRVGSVPNPHPPPPEGLSVPSPPVAKDINYYKSLIQQHGGERQESLPQFGANQELVNNSKPRDSKPKIMKPCVYFNSSRGCRHGANCSYQHDVSSQQREVSDVQSAKRMKLDREITGA